MPDSTILRFIQLLPNASVTGDFILKDLPGSGKRIDLLCRVLASCFTWGPITFDKSNIEVVAVFSDNIIMWIRNPVVHIPSGEKAWAKIIKSSLQGNPPDFVQVISKDLESVIKEIIGASDSNLWVLHEQGEEIDFPATFNDVTDNSFMLGDHKGFDSQTEHLISKYDLRKISLGNVSYLSSHCVALIISEFERKEK